MVSRRTARRSCAVERKPSPFRKLFSRASPQIAEIVHELKFGPRMPLRGSRPAVGRLDAAERLSDTRLGAERQHDGIELRQRQRLVDLDERLVIAGARRFVRTVR
jgi:hypothetical protein